MTMAPWVRFSLALFSCGLAALIAWSLAAHGSPQKPNILFILTDDQDVHMDSLSYMPYLQKHLISEGLTFRKHFCTVALCCPARGVLWSGQSAHNTNVTELAPPYGGYPKWVDRGYNERQVPIWLQDAGYDTYYVGKFLNSLSVDNYNDPYPAGWTGSDFLLDPYTYCYNNSTFQRNREPPVSRGGEYSGDVVTEKAHGFLETALSRFKGSGTPFFMTVAPVGPHGTVCPRVNDTVYRAAPIPAERHKHLFYDSIVPRTSNFNPDQSSGAQWVAGLPKQNQTNVDYNDEYYRDRLRSLQSVDEMIDSLMKRLEDAGELENTWIFYSTDNGFHVGQHRMQPGKQSPYEEDLNIPMIVRGPGVRKGVSTDLITSHTDLAPTFLEIAGASVPDDFVLDGQAMPLLLKKDLRPPETIDQSSDSRASDLRASRRFSEAAERQEQVNVEHWGIHIPEGKYGMIEYGQNTYKAMRLVSHGFNLQFTVWCTGEHELYDLDRDPYEMQNLAPQDPSSTWVEDSRACDHDHPTCQARLSSSGNITTGRMLQRLNALLLLLKDCKGRQCTYPWESYFPSGEVQTLDQALYPKYDDFFTHNVADVHLEECTKGYIPGMEGPAWNKTQVFVTNDEVWLGA